MQLIELERRMTEVECNVGTQSVWVNIHIETLEIRINNEKRRIFQYSVHDLWPILLEVNINGIHERLRNQIVFTFLDFVGV